MILLKIVKNLKKHGKRTREIKPYFGLSLEDSTGKVSILRVSGSGPAEKVGILRDDIISTINATSDTSANSSANSALGDTQAKRLRTDSSSSYGSLYGGTNFTEHDAATIAAQMEKVPSPYKKMFEAKSKVSLLF